jgi:photosystem II stability/assembly factor-like uncharacterized protein
MAEHDFAALRQRLEAGVTAPPFAVIRARRRHRTQRLGVVCAALVSLALLAGGATALGRGNGYPQPGATTAEPPTRWLDVDGPALTPSGTVYALSHRCAGPCPTQHPGNLWSLLRSTDLGTSWALVGDVPDTDAAFGADLLADGTDLWLVNGSRVLLSTDGGGTWQSRHTVVGSQFSEGIGPVAVAGGTLWAALNGTVTRASRSQQLTPAPQPLQDVRRLVAQGPDQAVALTGTGAWYTTSDGGAIWTALPDPCAGGPAAGSPSSAPAIGPDGTRWVLCQRDSAESHPVELALSTDGGRTWTRRDLAPARPGLRVYPVSATAAWLVDPVTGIRRTTDRLTWADVTPDPDRLPVMSFLTLGTETALVFGSARGGQVRVYLTHNGGRTWTSRPFG